MTNACLETLARSPRLTRVKARDTRVTHKAVEEFQKTHPQVEFELKPLRPTSAPKPNRRVSSSGEGGEGTWYDVSTPRPPRQGGRALRPAPRAFLSPTPRPGVRGLLDGRGGPGSGPSRLDLWVFPRANGRSRGGYQGVLWPDIKHAIPTNLELKVHYETWLRTCRNMRNSRRLTSKAQRTGPPRTALMRPEHAVAGRVRCSARIGGQTVSLPDSQPSTNSATEGPMRTNSPSDGAGRQAPTGNGHQKMTENVIQHNQKIDKNELSV